MVDKFVVFFLKMEGAEERKGAAAELQILKLGFLGDKGHFRTFRNYVG